MAGGENRRGEGYLSSVEILVAGTYAWTPASPLPQKYWYFRLVTLSNIPHMFGNLVSRPTPSHLSAGGENGAAQPTIFKYSPEINSWELLELQMTHRRTKAGTSLIDAEKVFRWCSE